ncbi:DUF427 domain-containing protein [Arthrobacter sp. GCM10027362]|uniref:DUF427 domain-containing protein n=1 Tax=Arthrobacter sp. GCM10027362 TaxID=3273379 RepID=UPI00363A0FBC
MVRAIWNGAVVAESDDTVIVEGNHYFPRSAVEERYLVPSSHETFCGWKGTASYYTLEVGGERNPDALWYYADPAPAAEAVRGRVAFRYGVTVEP